MSYTRGPYGGDGWALQGDRLVVERGLEPMPASDAAALKQAAGRWRDIIERAAEAEGAPARLIAAIGWSETRLTQGAHNEIAWSAFGLIPSTASRLAGRTVTAAELAADPALSARLCARYLVGAARTLGLDVRSPLAVPILASAYNAGYGSRVHEGATRFRMRYDGGADGGYLPRVIRSWNELQGYGEGVGALGVAIVAIGAAAIGAAIGWRVI